MDDLATRVKFSRNVVVFTGAGVSTLSGIRDFRGKNGIYKDEDADKIFSMDYFLRDPSFYYRKTKDFIYNLNTKTPSLVHTECARLEALGIVAAVITQNIDMLHQKAGSRTVIEVHGSPRIHRCLDCGKPYAFDEIRRVVQDDGVPSCDACGGIVKPDIVFFGERLDRDALEQSAKLAAEADLLLVLGSSLVVQPAASIPLYTLNHGGDLAIVNDGPTPLDQLATYRHGDLESCFQEIAKVV